MIQHHSNHKTNLASSMQKSLHACPHDVALNLSQSFIPHKSTIPMSPGKHIRLVLTPLYRLLVFLGKFGLLYSCLLYGQNYTFSHFRLTYHSSDFGPLYSENLTLFTLFTQMFFSIFISFLHFMHQTTLP